MEKVNKKLIPYMGKKDLTRRVATLLDWERIGDSFPNLSGVLLSYPRDSWYFIYFPGNELSDLMKNLSPEHEIIKEIIRQAKENLEEIIEKTREELKIREPRYLNSLEHIGGHGYECLFRSVLKASYHVADLNILTDDNPPKEVRIVSAATNGMRGYSRLHPEEIKRFLEYAWEKRITLPQIVNAYCELDDKRAIDIYFEIFRAAEGKKDFVIEGVHKGFDFKFIGRRLKRRFKEYDFKHNYQDIKNGELQSYLNSIFM